MKTFRQNLNIWLEEKKGMTNNDEVIKALEEVQKHIKSKEKEEESMVNGAYLKGHSDCEYSRYRPSFYTDTYKVHDYLKNMLKNN